jgi:polyhydroxyalkanoate synthase
MANRAPATSPSETRRRAAAPRPRRTAPTAAPSAKRTNTAPAEAASGSQASIGDAMSETVTSMATSASDVLSSVVAAADEAARETIETLLPPDVKGRTPRISAIPQVGAADPAGLARALGEALGSAMLHPGTHGAALTKHTVGVGSALLASAARLVKRHPAGPLTPPPRDARFTDEAWQNNPFYFALMQLYLLNRKLLTDVVAAADLPDPNQQAKAEMAASLLGDALAPTNFLLGNPEALRTARKSRGKSLAGGLRNLAHDLVYNDGWPSQVDVRPFVVGENLACSPGKVIYRNDLIELIQYTPTTKTVHAIPLLLCPPWINKYYIFDMAPGKSLVEWAVSHGLTTFAISYRNPDSAQRDLSFEDYLTLGPRAALEAVRAITGAPTVNAVSACIGGTLTTAMLAHLKTIGESKLVNSSTLLNCLVDHENAGTLSAVYADEETIAGIERKMAATGYLEAGDMAHTFDLLRANELVFRYLRSNWLNGKPPAAFDLLAWNGDSTRMPAQMQSDYLRSCWLENALARDEMSLYGERLRVSEIDTDTYIVAAIDDHIVPWRCSYKTVGLTNADTRFVLSSSGHIAGIINPPSPKARLWTNEQLGPDPDAWLDGAEKAEKSWWQDWAEWIEPRSGARVAPPSMGDADHPVLCDAPGTFVHAR